MERIIGDKVELKDKVCTLGQSKELDKLGLKIETENVWYSIQNPKYMTLQKHTPVMWISGSGYFAPDVAELMEMLPPTIEVKKETFRLRSQKTKNRYWYYYGSDKDDSLLYSYSSKSLPNTLSELLKMLIENNHIKPEEIKL